MGQGPPLSTFQRLGESTFLYIPLDDGEATSLSASANPSAPDMVVFCPWAFALPRRRFTPPIIGKDVCGFVFHDNVAKYTDQYQRLYPKARILLQYNNLANMTWRPDWMQMEDLQPAVWAIEDFLSSWTSKNADVHVGNGRGGYAKILFHVLSNGGAHSLVQLAQAYRENIRLSSTPPTTVSAELPISAVIFDSSPGHARFSTAAKTIVSSLPKTALLQRAIGTSFAYVILGGCWIFDGLGIAETVTGKLWRALNDPNGAFLFNQRQSNDDRGVAVTTGKTRPTRQFIPRTYIYSEYDDMIPADDVLDHAAIARRQSGLSDDDAKDAIRLEEFVGSMHVNHISVDAKRYWDIVQETVERSIA